MKSVNPLVRCLRCGQVHDSMSVENYLAHQEKKKSLSLKSSEPDYFDEEVHLGSESFVGPHITFSRPPVIRSNSAIRRNSKLS